MDSLPPLQRIMAAPKLTVIFLLFAAALAAIDEAEDPEAVRICDPRDPVAGSINCTDPLLFHAMARSAMEAFSSLHFSRFGRPVAAGPDSCDMAWRARPASAAVGVNPNPGSDSKDTRRFKIAVSPSCEYTVLSIGGPRSGLNARKRRNNSTGTSFTAPPPPATIPESHFVRRKYLLYTGGGDRCRDMRSYLNSLLCAIGEARYLKRMLVIDPNVCLSGEYTDTKQPEEGKLLWFYYDYDTLMKGGNVLEEKRFWLEWQRWAGKNTMWMKVVEDAGVTPMKLAKTNDAVIMRKFGDVTHWSNVCEGESRGKIRRPYKLLKNAQNLVEIAGKIVERMNANFDSVHIVTGGRRRGISGDDALAEVNRKIDVGRSVYVAAEGDDHSALLAVLKKTYMVHSVDDFADLWDEGSGWYVLTSKLNRGVPVEFDRYMRELVNKEVFFRGKEQVEVILE